MILKLLAIASLLEEYLFFVINDVSLPKISFGHGVKKNPLPHIGSYGIF
jgi:hypothetical protein